MQELRADASFVRYKSFHDVLQKIQLFGDGGSLIPYAAVANFLTPGSDSVGDNFSTDGLGGGFQDDSSTLHLSCTLVLLLLHELQFRPFGIRPEKLGTPYGLCPGKIHRETASR